jgi:hypothetical protein
MYAIIWGENPLKYIKILHSASLRFTPLCSAQNDRVPVIIGGGVRRAKPAAPLPKKP